MLWRVKILSVLAVICLQLSIFACLSDVHEHHFNSHSGGIEHHHDPLDQDSTGVDYPCQIHAEHIFIASAVWMGSNSLSVREGFVLSIPKNEILSPSIDHPPASREYVGLVI